MWFLHLLDICCWKAFFTLIVGMTLGIGSIPMTIYTGQILFGFVLFIASMIIVCSSVHINCERTKVLDKNKKWD